MREYGDMVFELIWRRSHLCGDTNQYISLKNYHALKINFLPLNTNILLILQAHDCKDKSVILGPSMNTF